MAKAIKRKSPAVTAQQQHFSLKEIKPLTKNQERTFEEYDKGQHLVLSGSAGSGKSFLALYLGLQDILTSGSYYSSMIIIRSAVQSRNLGFTPGSVEEKAKVYESPYRSIANELFSRGDAYEILRNKNIIDFETTSFLRGNTFKDAIVILDEVQNMQKAEIWTALTRIGENCRVIVCGDYKQNDLDMKREQSGILDFEKVAKNMKSFSFIEFTISDIVRSGFVAEFLRTAESMNL